MQQLLDSAAGNRSGRRSPQDVRPTSLGRLSELFGLLNDQIAVDHLCDRTEVIHLEDAHLLDSNTSLGMAFSPEDGVVSGISPGGPAFNSRAVRPGDAIVAVDGRPCVGFELKSLIKGIDKPGSLVQLTIRRTSGETLVVKLQRKATTLIAGKKRMSELIEDMLVRATRDGDADLVHDIEETNTLLCNVMGEEHDHDQKCIKNIEVMQRMCKEYLDEASTILAHMKSQTVEPGVQNCGTLGGADASREDAVQEENRMLKDRLASELRLVMKLQDQNKALVEDSDVITKLRLENEGLAAENGRLSTSQAANQRLQEEILVMEREAVVARATIIRHESTIKQLDQKLQDAVSRSHADVSEEIQTIDVQAQDRALDGGEHFRKDPSEQQAAEACAKIESQAATIESQAAAIIELEQELEALLEHHSKLQSVVQEQDDSARVAPDSVDLQAEVASGRERAMVLEEKLAAISKWISDVLNEQIVEMTLKLDLDFSSAGTPGSAGETCIASLVLALFSDTRNGWACRALRPK